MRKYMELFLRMASGMTFVTLSGRTVYVFMPCNKRKTGHIDIKRYKAKQTPKKNFHQELFSSLTQVAYAVRREKRVLFECHDTHHLCTSAIYVYPGT